MGNRLQAVEPHIQLRTSLGALGLSHLSFLDLAKEEKKKKFRGYFMEGPIVEKKRDFSTILLVQIHRSLTRYDLQS